MAMLILLTSLKSYSQDVQIKLEDVQFENMKKNYFVELSCKKSNDSLESYSNEKLNVFHQKGENVFESNNDGNFYLAYRWFLSDLDEIIINTITELKELDHDAKTQFISDFFLNYKSNLEELLLGVEKIKDNEFYWIKKKEGIHNITLFYVDGKREGTVYLIEFVTENDNPQVDCYLINILRSIEIKQ
jgi:hypothetical protein